MCHSYVLYVHVPWTSRTAVALLVPAKLSALSSYVPSSLNSTSTIVKVRRSGEKYKRLFAWSGEVLPSGAMKNHSMPLGITGGRSDEMLKLRVAFPPQSPITLGVTAVTTGIAAEDTCVHVGEGEGERERERERERGREREREKSERERIIENEKRKHHGTYREV